jgi:hypothetical protein
MINHHWIPIPKWLQTYPDSDLIAKNFGKTPFHQCIIIPIKNGHIFPYGGFLSHRGYPKNHPVVMDDYLSFESHGDDWASPMTNHRLGSNSYPHRGSSLPTWLLLPPALGGGTTKHSHDGDRNDREAWEKTATSADQTISGYKWWIGLKLNGDFRPRISQNYRIMMNHGDLNREHDDEPMNHYDLV